MTFEDWWEQNEDAWNWRDPQERTRRAAMTAWHDGRREGARQARLKANSEGLSPAELAEGDHAEWAATAGAEELAELEEDRQVAKLQHVLETGEKPAGVP